MRAILYDSSLATSAGLLTNLQCHRSDKMLGRFHFFGQHASYGMCMKNLLLCIRNLAPF